jgi:hypothetical protein
MHRLFILSLGLLLVLSNACTKKGANGPQGLAGANGTVIYSGTTTPLSTTGNTGDFYLDLSTGVLYGPKNPSGWGSGFSLVGQTGAAGAAGSKIYSGNGAPALSLGNNEDYYLDKTNELLYGPKTASGWGTAISLQGTANVIYSGWTFATNIRDTILDGSELTIANLQANELTSTYLNTATILVYFNFDGSTGFPLPYTSYAGGKGSTISFIPVAGQILITRFTLDNSNSISLGSGNLYRWVIIPGGVSVPNSMDYKTLSHFYGIPVN